MCYLRPFVFLPTMMFCAALPAYAQLLPFQSYTVKNGLLTNGVQSICQDSRGFLWVGTTEGLSVCDGESFTNYTVSDGLTPGYISHIIKDRFGSPPAMWVVSSSGGLTRFAEGQFRRVPYEYPIGSGRGIITIYQDHAGTIWLGMENGLARLVNGVVTPVPSDVKMEFVDALAEQGDSLIWVAARKKLIVYSESKCSFTRITLPNHSKPDLAALLPDEAGFMHVGLHDGFLITFRGTTLFHERAVRPLDFLVDDGKGSFWFGSYSGLARLRAATSLDGPIDRYTVANGLPENTLKVAFIDREHSLWLGGISQGITRLSETGLLHFPIKGINPPYQFSVGAADSNGHLWVASRFGLREFWRNAEGAWNESLRVISQGAGRNHSYPTFDLPPPNPAVGRPYSVTCDRKGRLWIGFSNAQLSCYEVFSSGKGPSRLALVRSFTAGKDFPGAFPKCVLVDRRDRVWYAIGDGIVLLDPSKHDPCLRIFGAADGFPVGPYVRVLTEDRRGNIWAGTLGRGVARISGDSALSGAWRRFTESDGLKDNDITSIAEDPFNNVWVGTEQGGITLFSDTGCTSLTTEQGLPSNRIFSIVRGPDECMWFGTPRGIVSVGGRTPSWVRRMNELIGFNTCCGGTTCEGLLWFVAKEGLLIFDPLTSIQEAQHPPVCIRAFYVNGRSVPLHDSLRLSSAENNCSISFIAAEFRDPRGVRYQYRLAGVEADWQQPVSSTSANYPALAPGVYTFLVRSVQPSDGQEGQPASLSFVIIPPFWRTWWFSVLAWGSVVVALAGLIRLVEMRKIRRRMTAMEQAQALERERLRISRDMHDEVGSSLTEIAILSEVAKRAVADGIPGQGHLDIISTKARDLVDTIGEIIWAINPTHDALESLFAYIRQGVVDYFAHTPITFRVDMPEALPDLHFSSEVRRTVFLVCKEAAHNVVKHARASEATMEFEIGEGLIRITITDNGAGFQSEGLSRFGHGLANMKARMAGIGGNCVITSAPGSGTRVLISIPTQPQSGDSSSESPSHPKYLV